MSWNVFHVIEQSLQICFFFTLALLGASFGDGKLEGELRDRYWKRDAEPDGIGFSGAR